ncbi:hypothetical protein SM0020_12190 [Sinorhizobium meliloti CCNWSX0020]|uniref:Uncharacterized protein n=1 Tax=Sinorhizobium meliloti CCNWSX0020 TaxID=1107881 RepID=H0FZ04_RHIML|nr:hypothetical protein [Sinorhizobium meliloti]EHK77684.1 hypothetical protein SM0020_12190 [Sinorhizobium meliloti CCNWSX0020]
MSITSPDDRISTYNPVVPTTEFPATFPLFDNDDIKVYVDGEERVDFAVSATYVEGISNDAKAVFATGVTGKVEVVGARDPHRTNRFKNGAPLPIRDQNLALDTLQAEVQEARRDISRSVKVPFGSEGFGIELGDPGQFLAVGADGQSIVTTNPPSGSGDMNSAVYDPEGRPDQFVLNIINRRFVSGMNADPVNNANRIAAAVTEWGSLGVGEIDINFPSGSLLIGVPPAWQVGGAQEGTAVRLTTGSKINFVGHGTILIPATNKIEMFVQNGMTDLAFQGIHFDNSPNGVLNNQAKPGTYTLGGGVAGLGNAANAAIRQYRGANLKVEDCKFSAFITGAEYIGNFDNIAELVGVLESVDVKAIGCAFPHLIHQPKEIYMHGGRCEDNIDSLNSSGSTLQDPGHFLYLTNRSGAFPDLIVISDIRDRGGMSSALKVRKGKQVTMGNINVFGSGRGVEISNVEKATVSDIVVSLDPAKHIAAVDSGPAGLELVNSGYVDITNVEIDIRGCAAFGARIQTDTPTTLPYANRGARVRNMTVMQDFANVGGGFPGQTGAVGKAPLICLDQVGLEITAFRHLHYGTIANTRAPIDLRNCDDARVIDARHICPDGDPTDKHRIVQFDASCSNGFVSLERDAIDVTAPLVNTSSTSIVSDLGTGNKIFVVGGYDAAYTPSVTFATPGNLSVAYAFQNGLYRLDGEWADVDFDVKFTPTYTTSGGEFRINLPFAAATGRDWAGEISIASKIDLGTNTRSIGLVVPAGASYALIRENQDNAVGGYTLQAAILSGTADVQVTGHIRYKRA